MNIPKMSIAPNCRYGHGNLKKVNNGSPEFPDVFAVSGMQRMTQDGVTRVTSSQVGLLLDVFECPVCGYTELFEARAK